MKNYILETAKQITINAENGKYKEMENSKPAKEDLILLVEEINQKFKQEVITKELVNEIFKLRPVHHLNVVKKKMWQKPYDAIGAVLEKAALHKGYGFAEFIITLYVRDYEKNNIKEARKQAELTRKQASQLLEVPYRTWEDWEAGKSTPPAYVERLIIKELERIKNSNSF